jgi:DNA-binding transcriptional LysR family regulator
MPAATISDFDSFVDQLLHSGSLELPMLPAAMAETLALCQSETADAARLSQVIHRDPTLAANVLKVANSAAFALPVPCASLQQAVARLGLPRIAEEVWPRANGIGLVRAGLGATFMTPSEAQHLPPEVTFLPLAGPAPESRLVLGWRQSVAPEPALAAFLAVAGETV